MKDSFEKIVEEHATMVLRVCRAVLGVHEADDAWSETFLSALRAYPELPENANVQAWLVTIAHRKSLDVLRTQRRGPSPREEISEQGVTAEGPSEVNNELWCSLRALPEKQRNAVAYHYLGGLPYEDVAAILGGTAEAMRRAASDGIQRLRKSINDAATRGVST